MKDINKVNCMKDMMKSIFCYGELNKDNSYLDSYRNSLSEKEFDKVFSEYSEYLSNTFNVIRGTYTDHEGCAYNSLEKKN